MSIRGRRVRPEGVKVRHLEMKVDLEMVGLREEARH